MKNETLKKYLPVIIVGLLLVTLNILAVIWYFLPGGPDQLKEGIVPGKIFVITETLLITADPRGVKKEFIITDDTRFIGGKTLISSSSVPVGSLVLVELDQATITPMVAREVRVMHDKRKDKDKKSP